MNFPKSKDFRIFAIHIESFNAQFPVFRRSFFRRGQSHHPGHVFPFLYPLAHAVPHALVIRHHDGFPIGIMIADNAALGAAIVFTGQGNDITVLLIAERSAAFDGIVFVGHGEQFNFFHQAFGIILIGHPITIGGIGNHKDFKSIKRISKRISKLRKNVFGRCIWWIAAI